MKDFCRSSLFCSHTHPSPTLTTPPPPAPFRYVLWRLILAGRTVVYEHPNGLGKECVLLFGEESVSGEGIYIADGCEPSVQRRMVLQISSPRGGRLDTGKCIYDEFKKDAVSRFMPPPSVDEILTLRTHCFQAMGAAVADDRVLERISRWGPVPRRVLGQLEGEEKELAAAIAATKGGALRELVRSMSEIVAVRE